MEQLAEGLRGLGYELCPSELGVLMHQLAVSPDDLLENVESLVVLLGREKKGMCRRLADFGFTAKRGTTSFNASKAHVLLMLNVYCLAGKRRESVWSIAEVWQMVANTRTAKLCTTSLLQSRHTCCSC